jgi:hypothetical protein
MKARRSLLIGKTCVLPKRGTKAHWQMVASIIISKSERARARRDETLNHQHRRLIDASTPIYQGLVFTVKRIGCAPIFCGTLRRAPL